MVREALQDGENGKADSAGRKCKKNAKEQKVGRLY